MKNILKVVFVIIGTLVGAGFASGQEIYIFFFSYGLKGIIGILITSILMGIIIYQSIRIIKEKNIITYIDFLDTIITNKKIKEIINIIINIFLLASFYIMIAGFGAYIEQQFNISKIFGSLFLSFLCLVIFQKNIKGLVKVNEILIPILILVVIFIGILNIKNIEFSNIQDYISKQNSSNWIISSVLYASYNSILLIPMLVTIKDYIKKEKDIYKISIISSFIIIILSIIIYFLLIKIDVNINNLEMPVVYTIERLFSKFKIVYGIIILVSIFTTAISSGTTFLVNISKNKKNYILLSIIICTSSVVFSNVGFSNLVNLLYPIFGYLGLIQIFLIFIKNIAKRHEN